MKGRIASTLHEDHWQEWVRVSFVLVFQLACAKPYQMCIDRVASCEPIFLQ
ncbi:MAG TPA: hypothetical protein VN749_20745 [Candidatus Eisenbacteria bacterium]|nr:hypothetical protein [Candidatus Eisenbacteria bacterium]